MDLLASFGPSYPAQEIEIQTKNGQIFQLWIIRLRTEFKAEAYYFSKPSGWNAITLQNNSDQNAAALYGRVLSVLSQALTTQNDSIASIDNPCNAEFIAITDQTAILTNLGADYTLKLNGQPT